MPDQEQKRVVVAMSGGVDSSVAAALLVEQGYEVIGLMLRLWSEPSINGKSAVNRCCTPDQMADARRVANQLNIPFYVVDIQNYFQKNIVQFFIDEHLAGNTPNPCMACNRNIRFGYLLDYARSLDAFYLATGHYAQIENTGEKIKLFKGKDEGKDQSYVLSILNQDQLAHVLFPVGNYLKDEVRALARKFGLPVASKQESQDLCFVADGDYKRFLREHNEQAVNPGPIEDETGQVIGQHEGLSFYTIGQRKGLGISAPTPLYVLHKDAEKNTIYVGRREALGHKGLYARNINWISGQPPSPSNDIQIKIRYKANPVDGHVQDLGNGEAKLHFNEPVLGITPGQGVVVYDNNECLGGGIIVKSLHNNSQV